MIFEIKKIHVVKEGSDGFPFGLGLRQIKFEQKMDSWELLQKYKYPGIQWKISATFVGRLWHTVLGTSHPLLKSFLPPQPGAAVHPLLVEFGGGFLPFYPDVSELSSDQYHQPAIFSLRGALGYPFADGAFNVSPELDEEHFNVETTGQAWTITAKTLYVPEVEGLYSPPTS